jgi:hypothetical protein
MRRRRSAQMAVLHLAHPDAFDPIVSADHKLWITTRFADVAGTNDPVRAASLARTCLPGDHPALRQDHAQARISL